MSIKNVQISCSGLNNILRLQTSMSHSNPVATATLECVSHNVNIGDKLMVYAGFGSTSKIFTGYVKEIIRNVPEDIYTIVLNDVLVRATDYFFAPSNPDVPFSRSNISGENLVRDILAEAGLTSYESDPTYFTFGINSPVEVKLISAYDFIHSITSLLAFTIYADQDEVVHFKRRLPYITTSDTTSHYTISTNSDYFYNISYGINEKALRNRVVVWGANGINAEASASSPYLPSGFYKSVVYSSSMLVQTTSMAQDIADYNLNVLNRLTYSQTITIDGRPDIFPRKIASVTNSFLGITDELWYVYAVEHSIDLSSGFTSTIELRK